MTKRTVVVDLDGVLSEFSHAFSSLAYRIAGGEVIPPQSSSRQKTWKMDYSPALQEACWDAVDRSDSFWATLPSIPPKPEIEEFNVLARDVNIIYLTGRTSGKGTVESQTRYWLDKHGYPEGELAFSLDKTSWLAERGLEPYSIIDDKPETIESLANAGQPIVIRDWPYNRDVCSCLGVPRVYSLGEWVDSVMMRLAIDS